MPKDGRQAGRSDVRAVDAAHRAQDACGHVRERGNGRLHRVLQQAGHIRRGCRAGEARSRGGRHLRLHAAASQARPGRPLQRPATPVQGSCGHRRRRHGPQLEHSACRLLLAQEAASGGQR